MEGTEGKPSMTKRIIRFAGGAGVGVVVGVVVGGIGVGVFDAADADW